MSLTGKIQKIFSIGVKRLEYVTNEPTLPLSNKKTKNNDSEEQETNLAEYNEESEIDESKKTHKSLISKILDLFRIKDEKLKGKCLDMMIDHTSDGEIEKSKQGDTGDCWLLSGINALSYTEEGQKMIKDALDYQPNGDTIVHLKGAGDYVVTRDELKNVLNEKIKGNKAYSNGDIDMLVFELAIEKVLDDVAELKFKFSYDVPGDFEWPDEIAEDKEKYGTSIDSANPMQAMYLITGKSVKDINTKYSTTKDDLSKALDEFDEKNVAMCASTITLDYESKLMLIYKSFKDINGDDVLLYIYHSYAVKNVDKDSVTVVDPHDSGKEIVLSRDVFLSAFDIIDTCYLNSENVNYIQYPDKIDEDGNKYFTDWLIEGSTRSDFGRKTPDGCIEADRRQIIYDKNSSISGYAYLDRDNNMLRLEYYDFCEEKKLTYQKSVEYFSLDETRVFREERDADSNATYNIAEYDENGEEIKSIVLPDSVIKYYVIPFLDYKQFDISQIAEFGNLGYDECTVAKSILAKNKNATFEEIMNAIEESKNK